MSVLSVYVGTMAFPASSTMKKWVYLPKGADPNETWIPIPYNALTNSNLSEEFVLYRQIEHGILPNTTVVEEQPSIGYIVAIILYGVTLFSLGIGIWVYVLVKFMQNRFHSS